MTTLFVVLLAGSIAGPAGAAAPSLRIDGATITNTSTGTEFVPHGVNWPSFEYACQQGWGYSNPGTGPETVEAMLSWRINTVRIPLNQDCWLGEDGLPASDGSGAPLSSTGYRNAVDEFVERLTDAGIVAMLDLHWSAPPGYPANGLRPMADSRSADFWTSVASRFRDQPGIIFDLFNEPHSRWDPNRQKSPPGSGTGDWDFRMTWDIWANGGGFATNHPDSEYPFVNPRFETAGMTGLVKAVRATGAGQPIVLSGIDYANDVTGWRQHAPPDDQLIAGFHNYPGQRCDSKNCWNSEVAQLNLDVPVITTEFGQNDCSSDHLDRFMDWADDYHIGYLAWAWWDLDMGPGTLPCTNYALIDDLDGTPTPGYGESFRNHLISLPEILPPKVDANPPQTTIDSGPSGLSDDPNPVFTFSADKPGSSFECRLDSATWSSCASPKAYANVPDGPHTAEFRAEDAAGNQDPTPATRTFTVDTTVYKAKIGKVKVNGPAKVKRKNKATYKVKIANSGNIDATGVELKVKGKGVKAKKSVGEIAAGEVRTVKVKFKPKRPGKVKVSFKVTSKNAGGKTVKKKIRVRK